MHFLLSDRSLCLQHHRQVESCPSRGAALRQPHRAPNLPPSGVLGEILLRFSFSSLRNQVILQQTVLTARPLHLWLPRLGKKDVLGASSCCRSHTHSLSHTRVRARRERGGGVVGGWWWWFAEGDAAAVHTVMGSHGGMERETSH